MGSNGTAVSTAFLAPRGGTEPGLGHGYHVHPNGSRLLHVINLCIVWASAGLPLMISFSAFRSSGRGRRPLASWRAISTLKLASKADAFLTETFCVAERFAGVVVRLWPAVTHDTARSRRDTDRDQELLLRLRERLQQIKRRLIDIEARIDALRTTEKAHPSRIHGKAVER
jgi:hypothetical protein